MSSKHSNTDLLVELMAHMHDDEIMHVAMSDRLICREADLRMDGLGNKEDRKQDDVYSQSGCPNSWSTASGITSDCLDAKSVSDGSTRTTSV